MVCDPESQFLYIGRLRPNKLWLQLLAVLESSQKVGQFQLHAGWKFRGHLKYLQSSKIQSTLNRTLPNRLLRGYLSGQILLQLVMVEFPVGEIQDRQLIFE